MRAEPNGFLVHLLNHSDTTALTEFPHKFYKKCLKQLITLLNLKDNIKFMMIFLKNVQSSERTHFHIKYNCLTVSDQKRVP